MQNGGCPYQFVVSILNSLLTSKNKSVLFHYFIVYTYTLYNNYYCVQQNSDCYYMYVSLHNMHGGAMCSSLIGTICIWVISICNFFTEHIAYLSL